MHLLSIMSITQAERKWISLVLALLCLAAVCALFACIPTALADDFSCDQLDDQWVCRQDGDAFWLPLYAFDQQQRTENRGTKLLRAVETEDWIIETHVASDTYAGEAGLQSGLVIYADRDNYLFFGLDSGGTAVLYGVITGRQLTGGKSAADGRYLKAVKQGNIYTFSVSADGAAWTPFVKGFTDKASALSRARVGIMNRALHRPELFHSASMRLLCAAAEYAYFNLNGEAIPLSFNQENGWAYYKSNGVYAMAAAPGGVSSLLRGQKDGDWVLDTRIGFIAAGDQALTGAALYADDENYLVLGVRGSFATQTAYVLKGKIGGQATGDLLAFSGRRDQDRSLRIAKRTEVGQPDRYYFYLAEDDNEYAFQCIGSYEDTNGVFRNGQYGLMALADGGAPLTAQFEYCTETVPNAYTDYFITKTVDGVWNGVGARRLFAGNQRITFASEAGQSAYLLRAPLKKDWQLDCRLLNLRGENFTGLAVYNGEYALQFGMRDQRAVVRVTDSRGTTETVLEKGGDCLRLIRDENTYIMKYSDTGLSWQEAFRWTDTNNIFADARYGLTVRGDGCAFRWFCESYRPDGHIDAIQAVEILYPLTGENSFNKTQSQWGFGSGDLGSMFEHNGKIYMVYGDTFSHDRLQGSWIHNAIAIGTADAPADGVKFSQMYIGKYGEGLVTPQYDFACAMIPSCGFGLDEGAEERLYMWVHEIYSWQTGGHRDISGMGWAVSADGGESWTYHPLFDGNSKFQFVTCWREDDFLYLYGNIGGGYGETYLMRVRADQALDKTAYRYYVGMDKGCPVWSDAESDAAIVLDYNEREIGITYNEYLDSYLMTGWDSYNGQMVIHESPTLYGPWSDAYLLLPRVYTPTQRPEDYMTGIYGAYTLPSMTEEKGKSMYFTLSEYSPYQVFWMRVDFEKAVK